VREEIMGRSLNRTNPGTTGENEDDPSARLSRGAHPLGGHKGFQRRAERAMVRIGPVNSLSKLSAKKF
jgi:hypothetical protein